MKGILIPVEGKMYEVDVDDSLAAVRRKIGCETVEIVRPQSFGSRDIHRGYPVMCVDEDGHMLRRRRNPTASMIYGYEPGIVGDVLILAEGLVKDEKGVEDVDLFGLELLDGPTVSEWLVILGAAQR